MKTTRPTPLARRRVLLASCIAMAAPAAAHAQLRSPTAVDVPAATIARVMNSEFAFCRQTEEASATDLNRIAGEITRDMNSAQQRVNRLVADSTRIAQAVSTAQTRYDQAEERLGKLQVARNDAKAAFQPFEDKIAAAEGAGGAGPSRHQQLMNEEASLRARIAQLEIEVKKANAAMEGLNALERATANEGPLADLKQAQQQLAAVMDELRGIRRQTHPIRYSAEYVAAKTRYEQAEQAASVAEAERDAAKKALDAAEMEETAKFDAEGLRIAHLENLYTYEHLYRAQQCVDKRREVLGRPAPPTPPPAVATAGAAGKWGVNCQNGDFKFQEGGTFSLTIAADGAVSGTYVSDNATYAVTGQMASNGTVTGQGAGADWAVGWSGTLQRAGGGATGSGGINVNMSDGGTCTGGWSIP